MDKKIKIILGILAGALILIVLFFAFKALFKKKDTSIVLTYWGYQDEEKDVKPLIDSYKEEHQNVSINYKKIEGTPEEYEKIVTDAIASKEGPDIFQIRNDWTSKHYKKLAEVPDSTYTKDQYANTFFDIAKNDLNYKDTLYAIPFTVDTLALFYNPNVLNEKMLFSIPDTWDGFLTAEKKMRALDGENVVRAGTAMGTANNIENAEDILYLLMLQLNTKMVSNDLSKGYFNLSEKDKNGNIIYPGTSALNFYASFSDPAKDNYTWNAQMPNSFDAFTTGKTSTYFGYASDIAKIKKATNEKLKFEITVVPQFLGNKISYAKYWANAVSKESKNQSTAWDFLKSGTEKGNLKKYIKQTKLPSARKDLAKEDQEGDNYLKSFIKQAEYAKTFYKGDWLKFDKVFESLINDVALTKQPSQAAIDSASKKITDILVEFNKGAE